MSTITFSDVRNADARREFIENALEPTECHPTQLEDDTPMSIDEIFTGMPLPEQETPIQQHLRQKRMYVRVTHIRDIDNRCQVLKRTKFKSLFLEVANSS